MPTLEALIFKLYAPLVGWVLLGVILEHKLPKKIPLYLGKALFWVGVPISIVAFLRRANLSGSIWIAPVAAWIAILLGAGLAWIWIKGQTHWQQRSLDSTLQHLGLRQRSSNISPREPLPHPWSRPTQGSFLLAAMVGNTGYLGYPVTLSLIGPQYFAWALFYDTLGTTLGAYGLGVVLAARFGRQAQTHWQLVQAILQNPGLWSFGFGMVFRNVALPAPIEQSLQACAWTIVALSLMLIGMRLSQLSSWRSFHRASVSLGIKMLLVPLIIGLGLTHIGLTGPPKLVIVLQMAMPPAFATLVIAEAYNLDRELAVTALAMGSTGLLLTLPIWIWLFK